MTFTEEIFRYLDDGSTTLVFPTENASRYHLARYARTRRKSVAASRAIAFDEFARRFAPVHEQKPANKYHRLVFASDFLGSGKTGMSYLFRDEFKAYRQRFVRFIANVLVHLKDEGYSGIEDGRLRRDLDILAENYGKFLSDNGLFEPGWEKHNLDFWPDFNGRYVLVGYDADIPMQDLMEELGEVHGIDFLVKQEPEKASFEHFFTQEAEIETLFNRLEELKIQGVSTDDIIISTPETDRLASRLERKAQEYDTPLSFMQSLSLKETVPGRYLYALERCINEDLSFRSLENLLLNNALPFRDPQLCRRLVDFMVEHNVRTGTLSFTSRDRLLLELKASGEKETGEFYEALKKDLAAVRSACDGETLVRDMHRLAGLLFGEAEFSASEAVDRDVYSFVFNELSTMGRTLSECRLQMKGIFSVFMAELEDMSYVLQEKRTGIKVYRYGQDHLIDVPYHFVIGLSDSNCTLASSPMSFLEDHEISERRVHDITEAVLGYYSSLSAHVHISGSATSFDGAQGVPTFFLERNLVVPMRPSFPELFSRADAASLEQARMTALAPRGSDLARTGHGEKVDVSTEKLSYSAISGYVQCPYRAYLGRGMTKDAPDRFEPVMQDDAEMGTFLHSVVQTFMGRHLNTLLVPQELETYQDEMAQVMDDMLGENHVFDYYTKLSLRACYLEPLQDILALLLLPNGKRRGYVGPFMPLANEYRLKSDPRFTGYVDTIIRNEDGEIFLLDYKKGKADPTYQLILYKRLYDKDPQFGDDVKDCFFYSMKDSVFKGFDAAKWVEQSLKLDEDLERVREGYASGDWAATPDRLTCEGCAERAICRRRFNLQ